MSGELGSEREGSVEGIQDALSPLEIMPGELGGERKGLVEWAEGALSWWPMVVSILSLSVPDSSVVAFVDKEVRSRITDRNLGRLTEGCAGFRGLVLFCVGGRTLVVSGCRRARDICRNREARSVSIIGQAIHFDLHKIQHILWLWDISEREAT
jgi:hypothetical protein